MFILQRGHGLEADWNQVCKPLHEKVHADKRKDFTDKMSSASSISILLLTFCHVLAFYLSVLPGLYSKSIAGKADPTIILINMTKVMHDHEVSLPIIIVLVRYLYTSHSYPWVQPSVHITKKRELIRIWLVLKIGPRSWPFLFSMISESRMREWRRLSINDSLGEAAETIPLFMPFQASKTRLQLLVPATQ